MAKNANREMVAIKLTNWVELHPESSTPTRDCFVNLYQGRSLSDPSVLLLWEDWVAEARRLGCSVIARRGNCWIENDIIVREGMQIFRPQPK